MKSGGGGGVGKVEWEKGWSHKPNPISLGETKLGLRDGGRKRVDEGKERVNGCNKMGEKGWGKVARMRRGS